MGRLGFDRVLDCFPLSLSPNSCLCMNPMEGEEEEEDDLERNALMKSHVEELLKLRDIVDGSKTLAFHLEPKVRVIYMCSRGYIYMFTFYFVFKFLTVSS